MQIANHTFLVTGGASGLGAACARRLIAGGASVVVVDVNRAAAEALVDELGPKSRAVVADVTDPTEVAAALALAKNELGGIHGVIHCAGVLGAARVLGKEGPHDLALFERVVRVNLVGTFNVARLAAAEMANNPPAADGERGVIVMTASVAAFEGQIGQAAYSASKGGVASMTLPMARELARIGVRVVSIAPGAFETPMVAGLTDSAQQSLAAQVPFPSRLGQPSEFAMLAQQIIENPMLNGAVIRLDGALRMGPK